MTKTCRWLVAVLAVGVTVSAYAQNGNNPVYTVISVEKMHCGGCAKKIANKLYEVAGVDKIQVDVEKKILWVHPQAGKQPSPRGLWEAVERADDRPTRLHGPSGVFTTKPQQ